MDFKKKYILMLGLLLAPLFYNCSCKMNTLFFLDDSPQPVDVNKKYGQTDTSIPQNYPPILSITSKPDPTVPLYGIFTWSSDWNNYHHHFNDMDEIGITTARLGGVSSSVTLAEVDDSMTNIVNSDIEPMFGLFTTYRYTYGTNFGNSVEDQAFIDDFLLLIDERIGRYGPNGTFFDDFPTLPYKPVIYWEIWNEPNLHYLMGPAYGNVSDDIKADLYAKLLIASYNHIRANSDWDDVKIVGFSVCGVSHMGPDWMNRVLQRIVNWDTYYGYGRSADYFDIVSTHPYTHDVGTDTEHVLPYYTYSTVNDTMEIKTILTTFGVGSKPLWFTEVGWHRYNGRFPYTANPCPILERLQAAYVCRTYLTAMRLGVERVHIMMMTDADNFNGGFVANNAADTWYMQAYAVQNMISILPNPKIKAIVTGSSDGDGSSGYYAYLYEPNVSNSAINDVIVAWNVEGPLAVIIPLSDAPGTYTVTNMLGESSTVTITGSQIPVSIGPCPIYIQKN